MDASVVMWASGGVVSVLSGIFVLWLNALNEKIKGHDEKFEEHIAMITGSNNRISELRFETSQLYVSKPDLSELKKTVESMAQDIKTLLRESRK